MISPGDYQRDLPEFPWVAAENRREMVGECRSVGIAASLRVAVGEWNSSGNKAQLSRSLTVLMDKGSARIPVEGPG